MLNSRAKIGQTGLTLIELLVGMAILGILMSLAVPSFQSWMRNSQIRNAAESVTSGMQRARAEAVARNADVAFVLGAGSSWTIVQLQPAPLPPALIESRSSSEGSKEVALAAVAADNTPATTITFNSLGRVVANTDGSGSLAVIDFTAPHGDRNLRVTIGAGGNARMCDPNITSGLVGC
jgi:type IV fimbrial biogenesis protein FimT